MVLAMENRKLCVGILSGLLLLSVSCRDESISRERWDQCMDKRFPLHLTVSR